MKTTNLDTQMNEVTRQLAKNKAAEIDYGLTAYIKGAVALLESQGKDITQYSLIQITNPTELIKDKVRVTSQWRVVKNDELSVEALTDSNKEES